jgi:hypothetical protein
MNLDLSASTWGGRTGAEQCGPAAGEGVKNRGFPPDTRNGSSGFPHSSPLNASNPKNEKYDHGLLFLISAMSPMGAEVVFRFTSPEYALKEGKMLVFLKHPGRDSEDTHGRALAPHSKGAARGLATYS